MLWFWRAENAAAALEYMQAIIKGTSLQALGDACPKALSLHHSNVYHEDYD